jgi:hypothetical protein
MNWYHELVPHSRNGLDESRAVSTFTQRFPDFTNSLGQRIFHDVHGWPEGLEELVLRDDASPVPNEVQQHLKRLRRQVDVLTGSEQTALGPVKREVAEPNDRERLHKSRDAMPVAFRQRSVSVPSRRRTRACQMIANNQRVDYRMAR